MVDEEQFKKDCKDILNALDEKPKLGDLIGPIIALGVANIVLAQIFSKLKN